jgi:hypothetical protein
VSARLLAVVRPGQDDAALESLGALLAAARAERARVRLLCLSPLPRPRVDAWDRVVADTDREMDRLTRTRVERFTRAARAVGDVDVECVVRFGAPARELRLEIEAFAPTRLAVFESRRGPSVAIRVRTILASLRVAGRRRGWVAT